MKEIYQICSGTTQTPSLLHAEEMYSLLKQQQRTNKIPAALPDGVAHARVPARLLFHRLNRHLRNGRCDRSGRELLRILSQKNHFAKLTTRMVKGEPSA